ncbi:MAG: hypothetical protein H6684_00240 [Deltaproteobacteria bacterium]|nr:hypothetical protein [Deltaproteobacteria bacterium]MCB9487137.1 hypothetical protein [Deltaproteobacteria bacterium]
MLAVAGVVALVLLAVTIVAQIDRLARTPYFTDRDPTMDMMLNPEAIDLCTRELGEVHLEVTGGLCKFDVARSDRRMLRLHKPPTGISRSSATLELRVANEAWARTIYRQDAADLTKKAASPDGLTFTGEGRGLMNCRRSEYSYRETLRPRSYAWARRMHRHFDLVGYCDEFSVALTIDRYEPADADEAKDLEYIHLVGGVRIFDGDVPRGAPMPSDDETVIGER